MLAERLRGYAGERPIVVALPRGGVAVGEPIARALGAPLEIFGVRKLGAPHDPELGVGAVAEDGTILFDTRLASLLSIPLPLLERAAVRELVDLEQRLRRLRGGRPPLDVRGRTVILVDDGLATGVTAQAAVRALRDRAPRRLVIAVPVAAPSTAEALAPRVDEVIALALPPELRSIGSWYRDFRQLSDDEVAAALERARTDEEPAQPQP